MTITIGAYRDTPMLRFGFRKAENAASGIGERAEFVPAGPGQALGGDIVVLAGAEEASAFGAEIASIAPEGFDLRWTAGSGKRTLLVLAQDERGAMYGLLELAERLRDGGSLDGVAGYAANPRFPFRALKFNLPWSSYRKNECFELQMETVKDLGFWERFLDMMAEQRYNALTLWNLHPFPFMFRTAGFPEATPFTDEELADWKTYWTKLFRMAKERGIDTYLLNWNIIVSEAFAEHYDKDAVVDTMYHYGDSYSTEQIKQYTRESVTQLIDEYPDLSGFGVALGERMNDMTPEDRQRWIEDVYYEGMKRASRPIRFIHRAPFSVDPSITRNSIESHDFGPEPVWVEVKFNWSHAYSSPELLLTHGGSNGMEGYWKPEPANYKITWMVRNEDFFTLRWAQPEFVREHIARNGQSYVGGYYVGSECMIPGIDYSHIEGSPHLQWKYSFEKHWLYYMMWGRLLYDPFTPDAAFEREFDRRYGSGVGERLLQAYGHVCKMPMELASFYKFTWDFTLYAEGFLSTGESEYNDGEAFISLQDLLERETFDPSYLSIREYVRRIAEGRPALGAVTPIELAERLERDADEGLRLVASLAADHPVLECELADVEAWAHLGRYFAAKLRAGVCFETFRTTGDEAERAKAAYWLEAPHAAAHWERLVAVTKAHYKEQPLMHLGKTPYSWELFLPQVYEDIAFVKNVSAAQV